MSPEKKPSHQSVRPYFLGPQGIDIYKNGKSEQNLRHNPWWYEEYVFENLIASDNREIFAIGPHATDAIFNRSDLKSIAVPDSLVFHRVNQVWTLVELWEFKSAQYYKPQDKIDIFYNLLRHIHLYQENFLTRKVAQLIESIPDHETLFYSPGERLYSPDPRKSLSKKIQSGQDYETEDFEPDPQPPIHVIFVNPYCEFSCPKFDRRTNFLISHIQMPWLK